MKWIKSGIENTSCRTHVGLCLYWLYMYKCYLMPNTIHVILCYVYPCSYIICLKYSSQSLCIPTVYDERISCYRESVRRRDILHRQLILS